MSTVDCVRVAFDLVREDGWPPVAVETIWCEPLGRGRYKVDNIPFFVRLLAVDDIVNARGKGHDLRQFTSLDRYGGHCTIRLVPADREEVPAIRAELVVLGCSSEFDADHRLIATDVPPAADVAAVNARSLPAPAAGGSTRRGLSRRSGSPRADSPASDPGCTSAGRCDEREPRPPATRQHHSPVAGRLHGPIAR